jgi:hypothetical protein
MHHAGTPKLVTTADKIYELTSALSALPRAHAAIRRIVACCVLFPSVSSLPMKTVSQGGVNNGSFKN